MTKLMLVFGAIAGALAVGMAAAAAHALPQRLDAKSLAMVNSAIQMQGWHALALVLVALWCLRAQPAALVVAQCSGGAFMLGLLLFCGSVYLLALSGTHLGPVAPIGGVCLMAGWVLLAVSALMSGPLP
jgi:uncharacterized membrane protein YgdD (TMEM256/DUF423 family)